MVRQYFVHQQFFKGNVLDPSTLFDSPFVPVTSTHRSPFVYFFCFAATQLAHQVQQERTQVVCSNKVA